MYIKRAVSNDEVLSCFEVMCNLRELDTPDAFLETVRLQEGSGYRLAFLFDQARIRALAGFHFGGSLAWGHYLYVDDLVVLPDDRSKGYGSAVVDWIIERAVAARATAVHLDTGAHRKDAQRFYRREDFIDTGLHFVRSLE